MAVASDSKPSVATSPAKQGPATSVTDSRPHGRSLADFGKLAPAEKKLLESCRLGTVAAAGSTRPTKKRAVNSVRAAFVRFLALGGDKQAAVHERGVRLRGAWISGVLDLEGASVAHPLVLEACVLERIEASYAILKLLSLDESRLEQGFQGTGLRCGEIFLSSGFKSRETIVLTRATIEGSLDCSTGHFGSRSGFAIDCNGAKVTGLVFFGRGFLAAGGVTMIDADIGGDLVCRGGRFRNVAGEAFFFDRAAIEGTVFLDHGFHARGIVRFLSAKIGSNLECVEARISNRFGTALAADGACVEGNFFFVSIDGIIGDVFFTSMHAHGFSDRPTPRSLDDGQFVLDGFTYDRLLAAPVDAETRVLWLEQQWPKHLTDEFKPQPWEQLISVLREMGHPDEARAVAIAKHKRMRSAGRYVGGSRVWDGLYGMLVGYGYRPWRLLWIVALVWLACAGAYSLAIRPQWLGSPAPLLVPSKSESNIPCLVERALSRNTEPCPHPEADYRNFVSLAYSAEVLLPVISLGSKAEWRPAIATPGGEPLPWGWALFVVYWLEIAFGWLASLLLVAAIGNLVKKE